MAEPSRPPPPKAYVPSKKPGLPPSRPSTGPTGGQTGKRIPLIHIYNHFILRASNPTPSSTRRHTSGKSYGINEE